MQTQASSKYAHTRRSHVRAMSGHIIYRIPHFEQTLKQSTKRYC